MKKIKFVVTGNPKPKQRPRFFKGHVYTPKQTLDEEERVAECYRMQTGEKTPYGLPVYLKIDLYVRIPKTKDKKKIPEDIREKMRANEISPTETLDVDNCAKLILDALNGVAYIDDKQVIKLRVEKFYSEDPRSEIEMEV